MSSNHKKNYFSTKLSPENYIRIKSRDLYLENCLVVKKPELKLLQNQTRYKASVKLWTCLLLYLTVPKNSALNKTSQYNSETTKLVSSTGKKVFDINYENLKILLKYKKNPCNIGNFHSTILQSLKTTCK